MKKIAVLLLLCSCITEQPDYVDARLLPFLKKFESEALKNDFKIDKNLRIRVAPITGNALGMTTYFGVVIDSAYFYKRCGSKTKYDSLYVECTFFHEMGHYLMSRKHTSRESIMCPKCSIHTKYASDSSKREQLIKELFKNGN